MANVITPSSDFPRMVQLLKAGLADPCEHVETNHHLAHTMYCEDDTFGPVGRMVYCEACDVRVQAEPSSDPCCDCGERKPNSEMGQWTWYDYYAPQGDEPMYICHGCRQLPKHKERKARDRENYYDEFPDMRPCDYCHRRKCVCCSNCNSRQCETQEEKREQLCAPCLIEIGAQCPCCEGKCDESGKCLGPKCSSCGKCDYQSFYASGKCYSCEHPRVVDPGYW